MHEKRYVLIASPNGHYTCTAERNPRDSDYYLLLGRGDRYLAAGSIDAVEAALRLYMGYCDVR